MNGHSNIDTTEATEHLRNILNLNVERAESSAVKADLSSKLNTPNSKLSTPNTKPNTPNSKLNTPNTKFSSQMELPRSAINYGNENVLQQVELSGDETNIPIYGTDVTVYSSPLHHSPSLKIMIDNVVDYGWDQKYYIGRLISVHLSTKYVAYSLKSSVSPSGFVRVIKPGSNDYVLLKGFKGNIKDLAFAYSLSRLVLACIDDGGYLFVFEITDDGTKMEFELIMHVAQRQEESPTTYTRIVWCPYVPDETSSDQGVSDDDMTMLLCITYNERVEIYNVDCVVKECGKDMLYSDEIKIDSFLSITQHAKPVIAAAFSPDGIALATASIDGTVKFFQLNALESEHTPKYLHTWRPHNGKAMSTLFFLDNLKTNSPDEQFWKLAITGADNNQEIKLWSCQSWTCLQTISFKPNHGDVALPCLKADIDFTGRYLFLSDISRKVLYILKIKQERESGHTFICSLSEFPVKFPVLALGILYVTHQKAKSGTIAKSSCDIDDDDDADNEDDDDSDEISSSIKQKSDLDYLIRLYWIHTKSLQSCRIIYSAKNESPVQSVSSVGSSQDSFVFRDGLSELITDEQTDLNIIERNDTSDTFLSPNAITTVLATPPSSATATSLAYHACDEILLTPNDFTSPSHTDLPSVNISNSFTLASVDEVCSNLESNKLTSEQNISSMQVVSPDINPCSRRKSSQHSSSSSPSREVAEILSPRQLLNQDHENVSPCEEKDDEMLSSNEHNDTVICDSPPSQPFQSKEWPTAPPDPTKEYATSAVRNENDIHLPQSAEQHDQTRHDLSPLGDGDVSPHILGNDASFLQLPYLQRMEESMDALNHKLSAISDVVHRQNQVIQFVQTELQELRQQQKYTHDDVQSFGTMDTNISNKLEKLLSANAVAEYARIESLFSKRDTNDKQHIEQQSAVLSQNLLSVISPQLDQIVKQEIQNTIGPQIRSYTDSLVGHLQENLMQKLNTTDTTIKDCVAKYLKSKAFGESIAQAVLAQLQKTVQIVCRDTFQTSVIPAFDKSCQLLIGQMNEIFVTGTTEYVQQLERQRKSTCDSFEASINRLQEQLKKLSTATDGAYERQLSGLEQSSTQSAKQSEVLIQKVRQAVHDEVQKALQKQASSIVAMTSRTATPAIESEPNPNVLLQLVKQGKINDAFHQALCGHDIEIVILLCQSVTLDQIFGTTPCVLSQDVLLALIHQLAGDLSDRTDLKVKFIEDSIASLDVNHEITKTNFGKVFLMVEQKINAFVQKNPTHPLLRSFRRILLAGRSLLK